MQPYAPRGGAFAKVHAEHVHEDEEWDAESLPLERYDARQRERGRRSFVLRALDEQRSLLAFSELLTEMAEAGAPVDVIGSLARVVRDEARHVDLCGRVVERLGGWPADAPAPSWVRSDRRAPLRERILKTVVGSLCIGETISVAMLGGVRESASDPFVAKVLTRMLADESFHSRFGWWWLASESAALTDAERAMLDAWLPKVLAAIEASARPARSGSSGRAYLACPFGSMSPEARSAALDRALERTILPGLEEAGLDARGAWERAQLGDPGRGTMRTGKDGLGMALAIARTIARAAGGGAIATALAALLAVAGCTRSHGRGAELDRDGDGYTVEGGDCDDARRDVHPMGDDSCGPATCEALPVRDGVDQDCDGRTDEGCGIVTNCFGDAGPWVPDAGGIDRDGDGWTEGADCDDGDPAVSPGAAEQCTSTCESPGRDEDCDGSIDEGCTIALNCFYDADGDGYGDGFGPGPDCDDADPMVYPGAYEYCYDGRDSDCDGDASDTEEGCVVLNGMRDVPSDDEADDGGTGSA